MSGRRRLRELVSLLSRHVEEGSPEDIDPGDDIDPGEIVITPEDEEFFLEIHHASDSRVMRMTDAEHERYESLMDKLMLLLASVVPMWTAHRKKFLEWTAMDLLSTYEKSTPEQLQEFKASEMTVRQVLDVFVLYQRLGACAGEDFGSQLDMAWSDLAYLILIQKEKRDAQAQKIYLSLLVKSLAKFGPRHQSTLTYVSNIAASFKFQGHFHLAARLYHMVYILHKHGGIEGSWLAGTTDSMVQRLQLEIGIMLQDELGAFDTAEPFLRECCEREATALQAKNMLDYPFINFSRLGICCLKQNKFLEAEQAFQRALPLVLKEVGIKPMDQRLEELQGVSVKILKQMAKEDGIALPPGLEKGELVQHFVEKSHIKALSRIESWMVVEVMSNLGNSLLQQKEDSPEKLPAAEKLHRLVLAARMAQPAFGPKHIDTLESMDALRATLSAQFKFVEALSIGEKSLSIRARLFRDDPGFQMNLESQKEDLQRQIAFRAAAEKLLGPRDSWVGSEDGQPSALVFQETVRKASAKRAKSGIQASSSSRSSSRKRADPDYRPVQFDVHDEAEVNYGALMAGMGITRIGVKKVIVGGKRDEEIALQTYSAGDLTGVEGLDQSNKVWATTIALMRDSMRLPNGPPFSAADTKSACLNVAFEANKTWMDKVQDAVQQASESKEVHRQQEDERAAAEAQGELDGEPKGPLRRSKPLKICIGCGAYGAQKKCSRCQQAYVCSSECFNAAWHAFHKHTCVRRERK